MNSESGFSNGTGYIGTIYSVFAVAFSMLPELDIWMRIFASLSAIIAAWVSIFLMLSKIKRNQDK
jgi:predicted membrane-bound spermidine synthase